MKTLTITILALILAVGIEILPSKPLVEYRDVETFEQIKSLETLGAVEKEGYERKPVYCSDVLGKYSWDQSVAYNVMMVESDNKPRNLNDNPNTGDYSVGCFQINLLNENQTAKYNIATKLGYTGPNERQSLTEWLWEPENNVAVAHHMWQGQSWSPWSYTTCKKVSCY